MPSRKVPGVQELAGLALKDLAAAFAHLVHPDARLVRDALAEILPALTEKYGSAAAALSANWYEQERERAGAPGTFGAVLAELPGRERTDALAGWAVSPLFAAEPDPATALVKAQGGLQRIVANASRETVMASAVADPGSGGWKRVGVGRDCPFCAMLIGHGHVYNSVSAEFVAHDHCNCAAAPEF